MKEIYEMMLLFSVISYTLGSALPIHYQFEEKKEEGDDNEIKEQLIKLKLYKNLEGDTKSKKSQKFIIISRKSVKHGEITPMQEFFGTKDKTKSTLFFLIKYFIAFFLAASYFFGSDAQLPEILVVLAGAALYVKFLF